MADTFLLTSVCLPWMVWERSHISPAVPPRQKGVFALTWMEFAVPPETAKTPTLADVAALAGVSPATASRVINESARVSHRARAQVESAVERLRYVPHRAVPRGGSIAALICEDDARVFSDGSLARLLGGVRRELGDRRELVVLVTGITGITSRCTTVSRFLRSGQVDGVLLISAHDAPYAALQHGGIPVVLGGRPLRATPLPYVDADDRGGACVAVDYLAGSGRRAIGTIAGPPDRAAGVNRLAGYRAAMAAHGATAPGLITYGDFRQASGEHAMNRLLDRRPDIDAVLAASDQMAVGALRALRRTGRRVPDDVAVVGFDDAPIAGRVRPRLTTVRRPIEEMGARMARELLGRIAGAPDRNVVLDTKLIIRDSA
jgi:DNA-binding LacI/PurR family transcriptional regulator